MKIKRNKWIPFKGFRAINLFGVIFARHGARISETTVNHESIHTAQMKELLYILFYIWYFIEWIIRVVAYSLRFLGRLIRDKKRKFRLRLAYRKMLFEREAYKHEDNFEYLKTRKCFAFLKK